MNNQENQKKSSIQYKLTGVLDQKTVPELWQQRNKTYPLNGNNVIDLTSVSHCDSAGLAFLTCLQSEAIASKQLLSFINIPQQLHQLIELNRLEDVLNCQQPI